MPANTQRGGVIVGSPTTNTSATIVSNNSTTVSPAIPSKIDEAALINEARQAGIMKGPLNLITSLISLFITSPVRALNFVSIVPTQVLVHLIDDAFSRKKKLAGQAVPSVIHKPFLAAISGLLDDANDGVSKFFAFAKLLPGNTPLPEKVAEFFKQGETIGEVLSANGIHDMNSQIPNSLYAPTASQLDGGKTPAIKQ